MAALALTRAQVIAEGLSQAGRSDLTSNARLWLNLLLEEVYMTQDFDWLVKTNDSFSVSEGVSFPSDYRHAKSAVLVHPNESESPIDILANAAEYDYKRLSVGPDTEGQPKFIYANHDERKFYFLPTADQAYTLKLKYFYIPSLPDHTDSGTDSQTIKWGLPSKILIDYIKAMAFEYNDDTRQEAAFNMIMAKIAQGKMNNQDRRAGSSRMAMGKSFRKRFR